MKLLREIFYKTIILFVFISPWLLSASAERIDYCDSIAEEYAGWSSNVTLPKFDTSLGTLREVDLSCEMNLSQEVMIENENPNPTNYTLILAGELTVGLPSSDGLSISFNQSTAGNLSGYDGNTDYAGSSGTKSVIQIPTEAAAKSIADISDFLANAPGESKVLPVVVDAISQTKTSGRSNSGVFSIAGAEVCVSYTYDPKSEEGGQN
jgi:hypothetical protein